MECRCSEAEYIQANPLNSSKYVMIPVNEAVNIVIQRTIDLFNSNGDIIQLDQALNYTLSESIYAAEDFPLFPASIMDGYAFNVTNNNNNNNNNIYSVVGNDITAGVDSVSQFSLQGNECVYITTGSK